ncbi:Hypothetical predicted protein [Octopus vulgaris]|uniref:Uncharacterized protein n=1 Tax=Octopus vulgaris TaxID=6645 RepID=A0AA36F035_OCTVU|nr:Hypothetical predicted protein [Octopus vulgaris]
MGPQNEWEGKQERGEISGAEVGSHNTMENQTKERTTLFHGEILEHKQEMKLSFTGETPYSIPFDMHLK